MTYHKKCSGPRGQAYGDLPCGHMDQSGDSLCFKCAKKANACRLCGEPLKIQASTTVDKEN